MKHKKVMRRNLTATALAGVIVTAAVTGLTGYYSAQAALTQEATKYLSQLRDSTSQMISAWFSERVLEVQSLARDNTIEEFLANGDAPDPASAASQRLVEVVSLSRWYEAISLADAEGLVVAASDAHVVGNLRVPDRTISPARWRVRRLSPAWRSAAAPETRYSSLRRRWLWTG